MNEIYTIALNTYRESVRSKILYSVLMFAFLFIFIASIFGSVTVGDQVKVLKDFGLFTISLFGVVYIIINGSTLLNKELTKKTIFNILSKPVSRSSFVVGKFIGMFFTVVLIQLIMGILFALFVYLFENKFDYNLFIGFFCIFLQMFIVCALVVFFSTIVVTPMLSGAFTFGIYLTGRSTIYIETFITQIFQNNINPLLQKTIMFLIPQLDKIDVNNEIVYGMEISSVALAYGLIYSITYVSLLLIFSCYFFKNRQFN